MKYEFKIDGNVVDLEKFYTSIHDEIDGDIQWHELLDTGSIDLNGTVYSIEVASYIRKEHKNSVLNGIKAKFEATP